MFFLTEIPLFILTAGKGKTQFLINLFIFSIILASAYFIKKKFHLRQRFEIAHPVAISLICLTLSALFFRRWGNSLRMQPIADFLNLPLKQSCLLISFVLAFLSLPGVDFLITLFLRPLPKPAEEKIRMKNTHKIILFFILTSLLITLINSKGSPLYPFHDGCDQNTMFTVGKGALKDHVLYRDLYEQKGPLLLFIHTFGAAISYDTLTGVWLLEPVFCFFFLYLLYKTAAMFSGGKVVVLIPLLAVTIYSSKSFGMGDSGEEFALPLMAYAFYVGCKALKDHELPSDKEFLMIGLTSGAVFWMKYSMIGFYFGWFFIFLLDAVIRGETKKMIRGTCLIAAGAFTITLPILLYFLFNSALDSLYEAYFYNNLVHYPANHQMSFLQKMAFAFSVALRSTFVPMLISFAGLIYTIIRKQWKLLVFTVTTFVSTFIFVYISGNFHFYYSLIFSIFTPFGICLFLDILSLFKDLTDTSHAGIRALSSAALFAAMILLCSTSRNLISLEFPKEELMPFKMKEIIESSGISNPTVLSYRILDVGVNTAARLIPNLKYFCYYNNDDVVESLEEQETCLAEQCVDFVIEQSSSPYTYREIETYEHQGTLPAWQDDGYIFFHYFTPKDR